VPDATSQGVVKRRRWEATFLAELRRSDNHSAAARAVLPWSQVEYTVRRANERPEIALKRRPPVFARRWRERRT
jgi:hypothetical protein